MFKLQRLEITGFKSFADYTEIVFTGNGITAVVGPNGCGKSNVSDAISWVLGEQRAKSLRGGEMKDVVFQGSRNRKPSGMAEVVLHMVRDEDSIDYVDAELEDIDEALNAIDDHSVDMTEIEGIETEPEGEPVDAIADGNGFRAEEFEALEKVQAAQVGSVKTVERHVKTKRHWRPRSFALDFAPGESVSVTRRLYLSGESEYQLNGKTCRLRDIQDLFAGTGLSGAHYAIIEQGRIGQILSAKPSDRRSLIEEAAGISKFRTRQRAAESRLDAAKGNLSRISDIVSEIDKQANSLRRQAGKTRRFIALQEEFRVLLGDVFAAEGRHYSTLIEELKAKLQEALKTEAEFAAKVAAKEEAFREATHSARLAEEALAEIRRKHSENALERDRADREHRYQSEQIVGFNNRTEAIRGEIAAITERMELADSEIKRLEKDDRKESEESQAAAAVLQAAEAVYAEKLDAVRKIEADLEIRRGELLQHTAAVERFNEIERQLHLNSERLNQQLEGLKKEAVRAEQAFTDQTTEAEKTSTELADEQQKLNGLLHEKKEMLAVSAEARDALRASEEVLKRLRDEFSRNRHRLETLQELEEKRAVYAPQIQKLFAEQDKIGVHLNGVLADFLNVDEGAERAVENLFGAYLQTILVEKASEAQKVGDWLRSNDIGRVATLVAPAVEKSEANTNGARKIEDLLGISDKFRDVLREVFPREMSAELVEKLPSNGWVSKELTFVDLDGNMLVAGSLYIGGKQFADTKNESLLAFKRELTGLGKTVAKLEKEIGKAEQRVAADRAKLVDFEEKTVDLQSLIIKVERGIVGLEAHERSVKQEIERAGRHQHVVAAETAQVEAEISDIAAKIEDAAAKGTTAGDLQAEVRGELERISETLRAARAEAEAENLVLNEKRTIAATSDERRRSVQAALRRVENEKKELALRITALERELTEIDEKIGSLRASVSEIAARIASAGDDLSAEQAEIAAAVESVKAAREAADAMSGELADLNRKSAEALNERASIEVRQTEAITELRNISEQCVHELNTPLTELVEARQPGEEFDLIEARRTVEEMRQRLDSFGAINMLAVDELSEAEERLLFLTSQRQDIIDSIQSTEEALREIKERSRTKFKEAFEAVNANFVEFFQELFGGGRGEMTLLESDDILEAGIEVVAQPPGKRLQNILLLSGGEKAMTAIALVLAIFKYRPSPFCLLDEVDAPLDDANVGRFVNKIAEMSEKTQFIVITHNKRTMEAARALYGVTMQEAGVSKIVSVKFD